MRLIDADALVMHMADWQLSASSDQYGTIEEAIDAVASAPTIDAVPATIEGALGYLHKVGWMQEHDRIMTKDAAPVRHGRWMPIVAEKKTTKELRGAHACSECGASYFSYYDVPDIEDVVPNYCPNCGAKMDGDAND